jgi:hypothetical protein
LLRQQVSFFIRFLLLYEHYKMEKYKNSCSILKNCIPSPHCVCALLLLIVWICFCCFFLDTI